MTTFFDIIKKVCILANEEAPDTFSTEVGKIPQIKQYINDILQEICTKYNFTFREDCTTINTVIEQDSYAFIDNPFNILENGIRIEDSEQPLYYIPHNELDKDVQASGKPSRYAVYNGNLILDAIPDNEYEIKIKYLTSKFALSSLSEKQQYLELEDDTTIIPDYFIKTLVWGAYSLYRQGYKVDNKYSTAKEKYLTYLSEMIKNNGYTKDESPTVIINTSETSYINESSF